MKNPANERDFVGAQLVPYGGTGSNRGPSACKEFNYLSLLFFFLLNY